jgi:hypothetical protein
VRLALVPPVFVNFTSVRNELLECSARSVRDTFTRAKAVLLDVTSWSGTVIAPFPSASSKAVPLIASTSPLSKASLLDFHVPSPTGVNPVSLPPVEAAEENGNFGSNGVVTVNHSNVIDTAPSVAVQTSGRIVTGGESQDGVSGGLTNVMLIGLLGS